MKWALYNDVTDIGRSDLTCTVIWPEWICLCGAINTTRRSDHTHIYDLASVLVVLGRHLAGSENAFDLFGNLT